MFSYTLAISWNSWCVNRIISNNVKQKSKYFKNTLGKTGQFFSYNVYNIIVEQVRPHHFANTRMRMVLMNWKDVKQNLKVQTSGSSLVMKQQRPKDVAH